LYSAIKSEDTHTTPPSFGNHVTERFDKGLV